MVAVIGVVSRVIMMMLMRCIIMLFYCLRILGF